MSEHEEKHVEKSITCTKTGDNQVHVTDSLRRIQETSERILEKQQVRRCMKMMEYHRYSQEQVSPGCLQH